MDQFGANPTSYKGVNVLRQSNCIPETSNDFGFRCPYSVVLGDNEQVPTQPNLDSQDDIGRFFVWERNTTHPYITFDLRVNGQEPFTAMNIEFLNYPSQGFSLPNLHLYSTSGLLDTDPRTAQPIDFVLLHNNRLSQDDYKVTNITLQFAQARREYLLLLWDYTGVYNLDFFMVSEVSFCVDIKTVTVIEFLDPQMSNSVVVPGVDDMSTVVLNCTVSMSGSFEWQWKQNEGMIINDTKFLIYTADGNRTSKLVISKLSIKDSASYTCEVKHNDGLTVASRTQELIYPGTCTMSSCEFDILIFQ